MDKLIYEDKTVKIFTNDKQWDEDYHAFPKEPAPGKREGLIAIEDIYARGQFLDWERFVWKWKR
ncbi:MAG: hypothetical protein ACRCSC_01835 [Lactococcus garvieae]